MTSQRDHETTAEVDEPAGARSLPSARVAFVPMAVGFALALAVWWIPGWQRTGHVPYVVDDAWIHLTIVRNLRDHGTFGVVPGTYESASSAPLWNVVLTPLALLPVPLDWLPVLVNVAAAGWILWRMSALGLVRRMAATPLGIAGLVVLPVSLGLAQAAATGMEHLLQAAIAVEVLRAVARGVDDDHLPSWRLAALGAVGTLLRFETAFLVAAVAAVVVVAGPGRTVAARVRSVVPVVLAPIAAIAGFAAVNLAHGQSSLPNSVLAKSTGPLVSLDEVVGNLRTDPWVPALALLTAAVCARAWTEGRRGPALAGAAALGATAAHLVLADIGNFDRYQEWLVVMLGWSAIAAVDALPGAAPARHDDRGRAAATPLPILWVVVVIALLAVPKGDLLRLAPIASEDIHLVQEQTARFLDRYHDTDGIGLHDLGWVAWLHDGRIVDLEGLATHEVMVDVRDGVLDPATVERLFAEADVRVAALYDGIYEPVLPPGWAPAGTWCVRSPRVVLSQECFTFYAGTDAERDRLRRELREFEPAMPDGVELQLR